MHAEALQHLGRRPEPNGPALLLHRQCGKENGHEPILPERDTEFRMPRDLKSEPTVAPLIEQLVLRQSPHRQATEDKRARAEAEFLILLLAADANQLDTPHLLKLLARDEQIGLLFPEKVPDAPE
jgi:hypothetical protein